MAVGAGEVSHGFGPASGWPGGRRRADRRLSRAEDLDVDGQLVAGGIGFSGLTGSPPRRSSALRLVLTAGWSLAGWWRQGR